ncbi:hypothetical protein KP509_01G064500 [Ceratopteris richardii]|uniref:Uncharacterized protein n=1 Tax=Ceratopteris richardii TaxID=49495 RepID=A0A8T2VDP0_CERRI|nr:hypothetical protein KP509_01G064500 [Ceratopteris richardii]
MGTATRTRSQTRKTRSICNPESAEQGASSPFTVLSGNNIDSLNKRHKRKPAGGRTLFDKENSAPPFRRSSNFVDLSNTCLSESSKKSSRKRKHEKQLAIGSNRSNNDTIIAADAIETPLSSQHELCRPRPDVDAAENPSEPLVSTHADISNDSRIPPAIEGTNGANENETDQNNRCSSHGNSSNGVPAILLEGQGNDISKTEMSKDKDGALVVSSSSALALLQKEYERLFAKYKKLKERRMAEVEALYDKQNSHISNFVQATEELTEYYKGEIVALKQQVEDGNNSDILDRCKSLERANLDCRSELLQEQAKGDED